jgi:hypothetical protein
MNTIDKDRLYNLLPYIYQLRDHEQGEPLHALLQVISEQVDVVEANILQTYENWFIETCEDWVVPYIGDLIGYTPVHEAGEPGEITTHQGKSRNKILIPRREVANTIRYRRRKGTLALLELLANDVAGWPGRAVEFYTLLFRNQHVNHLRPQRGQMVDLRKNNTLRKINTPFDELAHSVDVRRINSHLTQGRHNLPSVGLFVWRLKTYSVTETPVTALGQLHCYSFSVLGNDTPLYTNWNPESEPTQIAGELNLPVPLSRDAFKEMVKIDDNGKSSIYYGEDKSLLIWADDWPTKRNGKGKPIPFEQIIPADLSDWERYRPLKDTVAVDPVLGRIMFPPKQPPKGDVKVSYYYAFSADIGGGEYHRKLSQPSANKLYKVGKGLQLKTITAGLKQWNCDRKNQTGEEAKRLMNAVIEITDSGLYEEKLQIRLEANQTLQIRAANRKRPVIKLGDRTSQFSVSGEKGSYLTLDGLLISGRSLQVERTEEEESIAGIIIRHSTLVPGWNLKPDCEPNQLEEPSIEITNANPCLVIEHSIIGSIQVNIDEVNLDPVSIRISDSISDATGSDCDGPACEAIGASGSGFAHAVLKIARSTVFGRIDIHAIELAENSIFMGRVRVARRQLGCMRFCYVKPISSRTPKRYNCQPDLAKQSVEDKLSQAAGESTPTQEAIEAAKLLAQERVRPQFNSTRYGTPAYCQLADNCAEEIKRGADDESEMGAFHDLFQPQREANLKARLNEYVPARADVRIILVS